MSNIARWIDDVQKSLAYSSSASPPSSPLPRPLSPSSTCSEFSSSLSAASSCDHYPSASASIDGTLPLSSYCGVLEDDCILFPLSIAYHVRPASTRWRQGLKVCSPKLPLLCDINSYLFHHCLECSNTYFLMGNERCTQIGTCSCL
jgi:hypothetical protein